MYNILLYNNNFAYNYICSVNERLTDELHIHLMQILKGAVHGLMLVITGNS